VANDTHVASSQDYVSSIYVEHRIQRIQQFFKHVVTACLALRVFAPELLNKRSVTELQASVRELQTACDIRALADDLPKQLRQELDVATKLSELQTAAMRYATCAAGCESWQLHHAWKELGDKVATIRLLQNSPTIRNEGFLLQQKLLNASCIAFCTLSSGGRALFRQGNSFSTVIVDEVCPLSKYDHCQ